MVRLPTLSIIGIYFDKHRGLAISIYSGSASVGGLIFAPIITTLFDKYGFTGTMIIVGGLFLNIFVSASVMRPPSWFKKRHRKTTDNEVAEKLLVDKSNQVSDCATDRLEGDAFYELDHDTIDSAEIEVNNLDNHHLENKPRTLLETETKAHKSKQTFCSFVKANVIDALITAFDVKLLKDLTFLLYLAMAFNLVAGMILVFIYLPPFAKDMGLSYNQIAIMISAMACADFVSKIVSGFIADRKWFQRSTLLAIAAFATGSMCHFARFYTSLPSVMTMTVIMGKWSNQGWFKRILKSS